MQFVGLALSFSSLSLVASGRSLTAWLAVSAGVITFLLGHRLLRAAAWEAAEELEWPREY